MTIRRLGEAGYGPDDGPVGLMDALARAGLPVLEGIVLTRESHREFLEDTSLSRAVREQPEALLRRASELREGRRNRPLPGPLNDAVCRALIELGAPSVTLLSEDLVRRGLGSIPEVIRALREAWLSAEGLRRQIRAASRGEEVPTWPVLIQREPHVEYTGWSASGSCPAPICGLRPARADRLNLDSIPALTLEAEMVLATPVRLRWGFEDGRWVLLSASRERRGA